MTFYRKNPSSRPLSPARLLTIIGTFILAAITPLSGSAREFDFLHDHQGKAQATVSSNTALTKTEGTAFKANLERLRNLLFKQPVFTTPHGVEIKGYFRPNDEQPKSKKVPVPGFGYLRFHFYFADHKTGKPVHICCTTDEIFAAINDPDQGFESFGGRGFATKVFYEPTKVGEMAGFPIYRLNSGSEVIVLSRSATPPWIPVTREEFVNASLATWQKQAADSPPVDTITPQIVHAHKEALKTMPAEERRMQARELSWDPFQPNLAPPGSTDGRPLIRVNPAWFDPKLPRSAFQLIILRFDFGDSLNHDNPGPTEHGDITPYRVWQALHNSDWQEISGALTDK